MIIESCSEEKSESENYWDKLKTILSDKKNDDPIFSYQYGRKVKKLRNVRL